VSTLLLALPLLVTFTYFAWWPLIRAGVLSLQETNLVSGADWVGLANFRRVLDDPLLRTAVKNTVWFTFLALVFGYPVPIILAVLMSEVRRFRGLFAGLAYLPVVIPPVASILLWRVFYDAGPSGAFNTILGWVGLGPYPWIQSTTWAMPSIVALATWSSAGATVIIYLAALTGVRTELYEAAEVDGASIFRKVWHVTLPQLRGVLFVTLILQLIGTFQVFTEPFLLTQGGPANSTMTVLLLIYRYAFGAGGGGDYGAAAALSLMLAAFLALFTAVYLRATRSWST
jgi:multiple sugar transport system permease protein